LKQGNQSRAGTEGTKGKNGMNGEKKRLKRLGPGMRKECRNGKETRISYISCTDIFQNKNRNNKEKAAEQGIELEQGQNLVQELEQEHG
jgi:NADP-dependent 3-hydroxy acid dehydrogenase YdfG